jgi:hypothetical protein
MLSSNYFISFVVFWLVAGLPTIVSEVRTAPPPPEISARNIFSRLVCWTNEKFVLEVCPAVNLQSVYVKSPL